MQIAHKAVTAALEKVEARLAEEAHASDPALQAHQSKLARLGRRHASLSQAVVRFGELAERGHYAGEQEMERRKVSAQQALDQVDAAIAEQVTEAEAYAGSLG